MLLATIVAGRWQLIGGSILILESLGYLTYFLSYLTEENAILMNIMIPSLWMLPVLIAGISMAICSQKLKEDKVIVEGVYR
jgi:hypothetical protein